MEASIASILEIPESAVPDFGGDSEYLQNIARFLEPYGLYFVHQPANDPTLLTMFQQGNGIWSLVEGISPRGGRHACVAKDGKLVWDPHPEDGTGRGLRTIEYFGLFCAIEPKVPS